MRSIALHEESLALRRDRGDEVGVAQSLSHLGLAALNQGDREHAEALLTQCLTIARRQDDSWASPSHWPH